MKGYQIKQLIFFFGIIFSSTFCKSQKKYQFNSQGSGCHLEYYIYCPDNQYTNSKRPIIFYLGKAGTTAAEAFDEDTLRQQPKYYHYCFVYLPNNSGPQALKCLGGLSSLVTYNYYYGKKNLFFYSNDSTLHNEKFIATESNKLFGSYYLYSPPTEKTQVDANQADFTEDKSAYADGGEDAVTSDEKYNNYYIEEPEEKEVVNDTNAIARKTYFGSPTAYNFQLTGLIRDKVSGEALPFALVSINNSNIFTSSNADGYFTILKVPSDTSVLKITYVGYQKTVIYLDPKTPKKGLLIELENTTQNLKSVQVIGYREDVVLVNKSDVSTIKMTPKKLEQLPNVGERDILRSFQLMPGVSASNESSSGLYVRGGTPDQNLVLYDGFTIYHVDHLYGFFSAFNSNALKDVQLYKGGFESRFGGRLSSVTEITGKDGNQNKFNVGGDLSLLSMNVFAEIPVGDKFSSVIAYRRSYKGFIYNRIFDKFNLQSASERNTAMPSGPGGMGQSQSSTASSFFYDLNAKFTYRPTKKDVISFSLFNGTDKLDNGFSSNNSNFASGMGSFSFSNSDLTKYGNVGTSLKWSRKYNSRLYGNTILSYSNYYSTRDRSQERTSSDANGNETTTKNGILENNNLRDYSLKSDYQFDITNNSQLQFGLFATWYDIKYTYAQNDTSTILNKDNEALLAGGYLQYKLKFLKDKLTILPGVRQSYYGMTNKWYSEPRANLVWLVTNKLTFKSAWGRYYQFANRVTREDILSGSRDFWILSDGSSIPVSSAMHYIAGLSYENNHYLFSTEAYYKKLSNLTEYSLRFNTSPMGVSYNENFFQGEGFSKGVEFLIQKKSGKYNGWISYTLGQSHSFYKIYADTYYPSNQDVTHEFKIVNLYKYKRWDFSLTWIYATGRPYTAPSGAYSVSLLDGSSTEYFTTTTKNGLRLPDYHRMDLAINYKLVTGIKGQRKRREIGYIGFSIFNVYNRTNVWYKQFTIEDGAIIETNVNYLGFTPNLNLSFKLR